MSSSEVRRQGSGVSGFTLIELTITVAIVALLASVAMPLASMASQREKEQELRTALRTAREAIDAYKRAYDEGRIARWRRWSMESSIPATPRARRSISSAAFRATPSSGLPTCRGGGCAATRARTIRPSRVATFSTSTRSTRAPG